MGGGAAAGAFGKGASSLLETYHSDSLMARGPERCIFFFFLRRGKDLMKEGRSNFLIHLQRVQIWCWYSRSRAEERGGHLEGFGRRSHEFALTLSKAGSYFRPR